MKKIFTLLLIITQFSIVKAGKLSAYVNYCVFNSPLAGPYVETYLAIDSRTIQYTKNNNNKFQGTVEITLFFKQDTTIIKFDKYLLHSPEFDDTTAISMMLTDLKRVSLPNGEYSLEIIIKDGDEKYSQIISPIRIDFDNTQIQFSDITLIESYQKAEQPGIYTKNGYELYPKLFNYYPKEKEILTFYTELYNAQKVLGDDSIFVITYSIKKYRTNEIAANLGHYSKQAPQPVNVIFANLNIKELPSGNYTLLLEAKNKENKTLAQKELFFQRAKGEDEHIMLSDFTKTITNEQIAHYLKAIVPISTQSQIKYLNKLFKGKIRDYELMRAFFIDFWIKKNEKVPYQEWLNYKQKIDEVNVLFGNNMFYGFETDRGRIYLRYGKADIIEDAPSEPGSKPYQIWQYYKIEEYQQRNPLFIFCNLSLGARDYELIHSTAIGELSNPAWRNRIAATKPGDNSPFGKNLDNIINRLE